MKIKGNWTILKAAQIAHALSECNDAWVDVCVVTTPASATPEVVIVVGESLVPPGYWRSVTFYEGHQV